MTTQAPFQQARPIWPLSKEKEMNLSVGFRTTLLITNSTSSKIKLAAASLYRLFVNGSFVTTGPARGPHGYYRVDEWDLSDYLNPGQNLIAIEVASYNVNSYYLLNQPGFLQAEIVIDGQVVAATSAEQGDFKARILKERVQKVQRYSFQRTFIEYYRLQNEDMNWRWDLDAQFEESRCAELEEKKLLSRGVSPLTLLTRNPTHIYSQGEFETGHKPQQYWRDRSLTNISSIFLGYPEEKLEVLPSYEIEECKVTQSKTIQAEYKEEQHIRLHEKQFKTVDFGINLTGTIGVTITCSTPVKLYLVFDEILSDGDIDFKRLDCTNLIGYELQPGDYKLESMEPYTLRYLKLMVMEGECAISHLFIREHTNPDTSLAYFHSDQMKLNAIFKAGVESFRQNATDLFMDCPSRERAGWLCDSYFTARVEYLLTGTSKIEKNHFENYLLPESFSPLPKGMVPMCYPADHPNGEFIPSWALWFILELEEYADRSGDKELVAALKQRVYHLLAYFQKFLNEDGLLEKLESWVFVEWSKANQFVQDVNYPINMLYAGALLAVSRLYNDQELVTQSQKIREVIREQSFNGKFFIDNAIRSEKGLEPSGMTTEVCQYYAFYFDIATPDTHSTLWQTLVDEFGPARKVTGAYPEVYEANAFVGNYLRLELLSRYGRGQQLLEQMGDYFYYMVQRTGTLWEHVGEYASCNHGFASHVIQWIYREALGIKKVDHVQKKILIHILPNGLTWCKGHIPLKDDVLRIEWKLEQDHLHCHITGKGNYDVEVLNDETNFKLQMD